MKRTFGVTTLTLLMMSSSALAQEACKPEILAQKLELQSNVVLLRKERLKLSRRLDSVRFKAESLGQKMDVSGLAPEPTLPEEFTLTLEDAQGCTLGIEAEIALFAQARAALDAASAQHQIRMDQVKAAEATGTLPPSPATTTAANEATPAEAPKALETADKPAEGTTSDAPAPSAVASTPAEITPPTEVKPAEAQTAPVAQPVAQAEVASDTSAVAPAASAAASTAQAEAGEALETPTAAEISEEPAPTELASEPDAPTATQAPSKNDTPVEQAQVDAPQVLEAATETAQAVEKPAPTEQSAPTKAAAEPDAQTATQAPSKSDTAVEQAQVDGPRALEPANETAQAEAAQAVETPTVTEAAKDPAPTEHATEVAAPAEAAPHTGFAPLTVAQDDPSFQRVLTIPGASSGAKIGESGTALAAFSINYVFAREELQGEEWLQIGTSLQTGPSGWIPAKDSVNWSSMLVMQFAPRGTRNRVVFYENDTPLRDLISGPFYAQTAATLYQNLRQELLKTKSDPGYTPKWDPQLVAIEPDTALRFDDRPYLLPILDWSKELFDGVTEATMIKVAALPGAPASSISNRDEGSFTSSAASAADAADGLRVGVHFVVDSTISMGPFIDKTYETISTFYGAFQGYESLEKVSFGLTGFRADPTHNPAGIEYVSHIYQPLDIETPQDALLNNMRKLREATASTKHFAEDAIAGLVDTIEGNDWTPFDSRIIILVTDASALTGASAKYPDMTMTRLREMARAQNITIIPIHLQTPANAKGDADLAREQYRTLSQTGDLGMSKYVAVDASDSQIFAEIIGDAANSIADAVLQASAGELVKAEPEVTPEVPQAARENDLASIVRNEIFRAQLETLNTQSAQGAPAFMAGWTADRDLANPNLEALEVSVFLTRNQLSTLDKQLDGIVGAFRSGGQDPKGFFAQLQNLAAQTVTDPENIRNDDAAAMQAIMPVFLQKLPYRSEVLRLNQSYWGSMSVGQQQEFIETLEAKRRIYGDLFNNTNIWADFGSGDPGLEATPVRLNTLP